MPAILEFQSKPAMLPVYFKALTKRGGKLKPGESFPPMEGHWRSAAADPAKLNAYRAACGFAADGNLPFVYPYVLVAGVQIAMLADPRFPVSPMGFVHARNHILQRRPIAEGASFDITTAIGATRPVKQGVEFDMDGRVSVGGETVWECVSTYLMRSKKLANPEAAAPLRSVFEELSAPDREDGWDVPGNMGRRYARITGDFNPIHLGAPLAKLFGGFPKAIVHGMWSLARCAASLPAPDFARPVQLDAVFKGPVFMGSRVAMKSATADGRSRFDLFCGDNPRPVLTGALRQAGPEESLFA